MAVYCILDPATLPVVFLNLSQSHYTYGDTTLGNRPIKNAQVTIKDQTANTTDELSLDSGIYFPAWYYYSHHLPEVGHHYILTVKYNGQIINAETTVPKPVKIETFTHERIDDPNTGLTQYVFHLFFQDIAEETNYYTCADPNGVAITNFYTNFISDLGFDGKQLELTTNSYMVTSSIIDSIQFQVTVKNVTPEMEKYDTDIWTQKQSGGPLSQPVVIESNINGGLGIFGALTSSPEYTMRVK